MYHPEGHAVLCDFGLSRLTHSHISSGAGVLLAPVQGERDFLSEDSGDSSPFWDIACLGGVCYCLLSGSLRPPWEGSESYPSCASVSYASYVRDRLPDAPLNLNAAAFRRDAPPALVSWMQRCLAAPSLQDRMSAASSAAELLVILEGLLAERVADEADSVLPPPLREHRVQAEGPTNFILPSAPPHHGPV